MGDGRIMDMMTIRKMVMAQMASGKQFVTGTVTATGTTCTISFGKSFSSYLFVVEMTDASKTELMNSGSANVSPFAWFGLYPKREINNSQNDIRWALARIRPSTGEMSSNVAEGRMTDSTITFSVTDISVSSPGSMRTGYSYNYTIVSLD